jgi:hypothetical protein
MAIQISGTTVIDNTRKIIPVTIEAGGSVGSSGQVLRSTGTGVVWGSSPGAIPLGGIIMWSGTIATIPTGWALCNGLNGTPDLTNSFIIGASTDVLGASNTTVTGANTKTGGTKDAVVVDHTHGITDPGHRHVIPTNNTADGSGDRSPENSGTDLTRLTSFATTGITINSAGVSGTNQNLPPYYALAYIMRTS